MSLAWLLSKRNVATLTHSTTGAHIHENSGGPEVELDGTAVEAIENIDREWRAWDSRIDPWNQP